MCQRTSRIRRRTFTSTASEGSFPPSACLLKAWNFLARHLYRDGRDGDAWPFAILVVLAERRAGTVW